MADFNPIGFTHPNSSELTSLMATAKSFDDLKAAADQNNFGVFLTPQFEKEIADIKRARGVLGQLLEAQATPATGQPHRWVEQSVGPNNQAFTDPRTIGYTAAANGASLRVEKSALVRAISGGITFGLFDQQTNAQSGIFPQLVAKDLKDTMTLLYQYEDKALFTGTAANLNDGASQQYCSVPTQVTNTISVAVGVSIIDSIRTKIASMMADPAVMVKPTHIFVNPLLLDLIEQEIKNAATTMRQVSAGEAEVVPGIHVPRIMTAAGPLPLIPAWEMASKVNGTDATKTDYPVFIATMPLIENAYVGQNGIQLYKMGLTSDLADKYVAVDFNTGAIIKHPGKAHAFGYVTR